MLYITHAAKVAAKKANINNMLETMKILNKTIIKYPPVILEKFLNFNLSYKISNFISKFFSLILTVTMVVLIYYFKETKFIFPMILILISNLFEN